jgi:sorting nexin-4
MDHDDFDDVYSRPQPADQEGPNSDERRQAKSASTETAPTTQAMDLAGLDGGTLECTVTQPIKENDGTKDAYVSYLVTTKVYLPRQHYSFH